MSHIDCRLCWIRFASAALIGCAECGMLPDAVAALLPGTRPELARDG